jgi:hypothetical protein
MQVETFINKSTESRELIEYNKLDMGSSIDSRQVEKSDKNCLGYLIDRGKLLSSSIISNLYIESSSSSQSSKLRDNRKK